jgi:malonate-semialdehyde dehydrogenase (acetylating)/methylmalonate-semialdehyde dehydrogenase
MSTETPKIPNFINGKFEQSKATNWIELRNPASQELIGLVPQSTPEELQRAEDTSKEALKTWRETPVQQRQRIYFKLQELIRAHTEELALSITTEQGKTLADARGDVFRGLEVVETVCNIGNNMMGESLENLSKGLDTYTYRQPLGVTAGERGYERIMQKKCASIHIYIYAYSINVAYLCSKNDI